MQPTAGHRLRELDGLRALAVVMVMAYHYTTRFHQLFGFTAGRPLSFAPGRLGVQLFFGISGFVIAWSATRSPSAWQFIRGRAIRIWPAFAAACILTAVLVHLDHLPGREADLTTVVANLLLIHRLLGLPHVDGVYWSLLVELTFYGWIAAWILSGRRVPIDIAARVALVLAFGILSAQRCGLPVHPALQFLALANYMPFFAVGIFAFCSHAENRIAPATLGWTTIAIGGAVLLIDPLEGAACAATAALLLAAGHARLPWLATPILVRIGTLSYCLYLVHQNIGYVVERELRSADFPESLSIIGAVACALACAAVLHAVVEKPAMAAFSRPRESVSL